MSLEIFEQNGTQFVKIPLQTYEKLSDDAEMLADIAAYHKAKSEPEGQAESGIPLSIVERLCGDELPLPIWREYRGLTQAGLAKCSTVSRAMIAQIESGSKKGSIKTLKRLADALSITVDDLI